MDTTLQEIIYQALAVVLTIGVAVLTYGIKRYLGTKEQWEKYGLNKERIDSLLTEAVMFAEQRGKEYAKKTSKKLAGSKKLNIARMYIDNIDKDLVTKYANKLDIMITTKVAELFGTKVDEKL